MARLKPQTKKINSLAEADLTLKEIGILEIELSKIDGEAQKEIGEIKAKAVKAGEKHRLKIASLSTLLKSYSDYNKDDFFKDKKTVELTFGIFGYRRATSIRIKKTTIDLLKKMQMFAFIRIKEEPDKDKMKDLDDEALAMVDAIRKIKDDFFCEANKEEVNKELLKV